jgi:hypothetical protein
MRIRVACTLAVLLLLGAGCASRRPVLYPNDAMRARGDAAVQADVDECIALADRDVGRGRRGRPVAEAAGAGAVGGAVGAAAGAAGGAVVGNAGRGAAVGAATGAAGGATRGLLRGLFGSREPDPIYKAYVQRCLSDRGYEVLGWR